LFKKLDSYGYQRLIKKSDDILIVRIQYGVHVTDRQTDRQTPADS